MRYEIRDIRYYSIDDCKNYNYGENIEKVGNMILSTGASDRNKFKNIYDFWGNISEACVTKISEYFSGKNITLENLKPIDIQDFYNSLYKKGLSTNTVLHYHANIRKALSMAVKLDIISSNPADKIERPKKEQYIGTFYSQTELNTLLDNKSQGYHTHTLRHTSATLLYNENDIDIRIIKEMLGHSSLASTEIYTQVSNKKLKEFMQNFSILDIEKEKEK